MFLLKIVFFWALEVQTDKKQSFPKSFRTIIDLKCVSKLVDLMTLLNLVTLEILVNLVNFVFLLNHVPW